MLKIAIVYYHRYPFYSQLVSFKITATLKKKEEKKSVQPTLHISTLREKLRSNNIQSIKQKQKQKQKNQKLIQGTIVSLYCIELH
jgi:hypothetical protein